MNPRSSSSRLRQDQHQAQDSEQARSQSHATSETGQGREFASVEDMIRYDAANTQPPPQIEERLKESVATEAPPRVNWWQRLLGRRK